MTFRVENPFGGPDDDRAITSLLIQVFSGKGYTDRLSAERMSTPDALRQRGDLLLAKSAKGHYRTLTPSRERPATRVSADDCWQP